MSRATRIPEDLHRVASVAGTTAAMAEGAAVAAEKAEAAALRAQELAGQAQAGARSHRGGVIVAVVLVLLGVVGLVVWQKSRSRSRALDDDLSVPLEPLDLATTTSA
jgi:uncharacterized membrane protein